MLFYKEKFLKQELAKLENSGLLSKEQKEKIFAYYNFAPKAHSSLLMVFAAVLFALSLITLVGYNWEQILPSIRTALLLSLLLATQIALYLFKDKSRIWAEFLGILSNFVLLANLALLSQIYHLGDDTAMMLLSVAFVSLFVAIVLQSGFVFLQAYILSILAFGINLDHSIFTNSFGLFIFAGFVVQAFIGSKILAFLNFFTLLAYLHYAPWLFGVTTIYSLCSVALPLSLVFLAFNWQNYKPYALFTCAATLVCLLEFGESKILYSFFDLNLSFSIALSLFLLAVPALLNLCFKHYFLGILGILFWLETWGFFHFDLGYNAFTNYDIVQQIFYSFLTLFFSVYLIKNGYKILGAFTLLSLVIVRYINLLGDYIGASIMFALFGCVFFIIALKKRRQNEA